MANEQEKRFDPPGMGTSHMFLDREARNEAWAALSSESSCAFDFVCTARLLEWLGEQGALDIPNDPTCAFFEQRRFSRFADPAAILPQLVLFEKVFINTGVFYHESVDRSALTKAGFFTEYPRPLGARVLDAYRLLKPVALSGIVTRLVSLVELPFNDLWTDEGSDARDALGDITGLASWLYDECSKQVCGLDAQEGAMMIRIRPPYGSLILNFMEFALAAQGALAAGATPMVSSLVHATSSPGSRSPIQGKALRDDVFALYQFATSAVVGVAPAINSWTDVLRLREDHRLNRVRTLLAKYHSALAASDDAVVAELTKEIAAAKRALDRFAFTEHPVYTYTLKAASYVPYAGNLVSIVGDCIDLAKAWQQRKAGWIYFGMR